MCDETTKNDNYGITTNSVANSNLRFTKNDSSSLDIKYENGLGDACLDTQESKHVNS